MRKKITKKKKKEKVDSVSPFYWEDNKYEDDIPSQDVVYKVHRKKRSFIPE